MCTAVLIGWDPATPPPPHLDSYTKALLVNKDRRPLFVILGVSLSSSYWTKGLFNPLTISIFIFHSYASLRLARKVFQLHSVFSTFQPEELYITLGGLNHRGQQLVAWPWSESCPAFLAEREGSAWFHDSTIPQNLQNPIRWLAGDKKNACKSLWYEQSHLRNP